MKLSNLSWDLQLGFASAITEDNLEVQCCLNTADRENEYDDIEFLDQILAANCGHDDGICGDVNKAAFKRWGENRVMTSFFKLAEEAGIEVI